MAQYFSILIGLAWLALGITLSFNLGRLPVRVLNRLRSGPRVIPDDAIVPLYWRFWGVVLGVSGLLLIGYTLSR